MLIFKSLTVNFIVATTCCAETLLWLSFDMNLEAVLIVWIFCSADLRMRVKKMCGFKANQTVAATCAMALSQLLQI